MPRRSTADAPLSPYWAFVVQLREGTPLAPEAMYGRVEHLVTGQAALFTSLDELHAFMARVLEKVVSRQHSGVRRGNQ